MISKFTYAICSVVAGLAVLMLAQSATAAEKASLRLEWTLTGYHLPFYWAKDKGYYAKEGIDLEIKEGAGSGKTVTLIGANQDTFGFADYMLTTKAIAKGVPIKAVYSIVKKSPYAVISYEDKGIRKPQDLIGKTIAATTGHKALFDLFLDVNNIPQNKVITRVVSGKTRNAVFKQGQVDGMVSVVIGSPWDFVVEAQQGKGKPVYFMPFEDFGVSHLAQGIIVNTETIQSNPDLIRRFLKATTHGIEDTTRKENVDAAVDIALKYQPRQRHRRESVKLQWLATFARLENESTKNKPFGWMSKEDWDRTMQILMKTGELKQPLPYNKVYTDEFIPQ